MYLSHPDAYHTLCTGSRVDVNIVNLERILDRVQRTQFLIDGYNLVLDGVALSIGWSVENDENLRLGWDNSQRTAR